MHSIEHVLNEVMAEMGRAVAKFPTWPTRGLDAFAVLGEEVGELNKEVLQLTYEPHKTTKETLKKEAIQAAAMALRFLMSLDEYDFTPGAQHQQLPFAWEPLADGAVNLEAAPVSPAEAHPEPVAEPKNATMAIEVPNEMAGNWIQSAHALLGDVRDMLRPGGYSEQLAKALMQELDAKTGTEYQAAVDALQELKTQALGQMNPLRFGVVSVVADEYHLLMDKAIVGQLAGGQYELAISPKQNDTPAEKLMESHQAALVAAVYGRMSVIPH